MAELFTGLEHMTNLEEFWANSNEISNWKEVRVISKDTFVS